MEAIQNIMATDKSKVITMKEAVEQYVHDGDSVAIEGFTAFISFAAAHEIIRQKRQDLTLIRMTPDLVYDQMVAAGVAKKMVFSYLGNPGVGSLFAIRRAIEKGIPKPLESEEYSHFGMVGRYIAGGSKLPFFPLQSYKGSDLPKANPRIKTVKNPYGDDEIAVVPPINPDVAFLHAQRADAQGNVQMWGLLGMQKEIAFASKKVVIIVEELVDEDVIRRDPNRTLIPSIIVDAIVVEPYGAHPSYVQGYYDRDNAFYLDWGKRSRDLEATQAWLDEWVYSVADRAAYLAKLGEERLNSLDAGEMMAEAVNYGRYE